MTFGTVFGAPFVDDGQDVARSGASVGAQDLLDARLVDAVRDTMADALADAGRYQDGEALARLAVYDREGQPCRRCEAPVRRITQAGRSTYFCAACQRR